MNLPDKILEIIENIPFELQGEMYCAVINYMRRGIEPGQEYSPAALVEFAIINEVLDPILRRRRRAAAYRLRKKQEKLAAAEGSSIESHEKKSREQNETSAPGTNNLCVKEMDGASWPATADGLLSLGRNRRERRKLERLLKPKKIKNVPLRAYASR